MAWAHVHDLHAQVVDRKVKPMCISAGRGKGTGDGPPPENIGLTRLWVGGEGNLPWCDGTSKICWERDMGCLLVDSVVGAVPGVCDETTCAVVRAAHMVQEKRQPASNVNEWACKQGVKRV